MIENDASLPENLNDEIVDDPTITNTEEIQPKELQYNDVYNINANITILINTINK